MRAVRTTRAYEIIEAKFEFTCFFCCLALPLDRSIDALGAWSYESLFGIEAEGEGRDA